MLGRNHAGWAAAVWTLGWPHLPSVPTVTNVDTANIGMLAVTGVIAAGSGVVPDLDHPDARPSKHFGILSKVIAKQLATSSGGHRAGTHTIAFAALLGLLSAAAAHWPEYGKLPAAVACGFCASAGLALVGPSLGFRVPAIADVVVAIGTGIYVWFYFDDIRSLLWLLAAGGVIVHILCDIVTKGGVPIFRPFTRRRFCLKIFKVGGWGEGIAGFIGYGLLFFGLFRAIRPLI